MWEVHYKCLYPTTSHVLNRVTSDSNLEECVQIDKGIFGGV